MEQNQSMSKAPKMAYPPQTSINIHAYPPHYDTMATHYVHSLTSNYPYYYYFIPHHSYASGYHYPHHHYAHNVPQLGFPLGAVPTLGAPNKGYVQQYPNEPPKGYPKITESEEEGGQIEEESGENEVKSLDPRIMNVLEPFRQFYSEREETLKSILPGLHVKLGEFFNKVNTLVLNTVKFDSEKSNPKTLKRSLSLGSSPLRNEWFKVKPIDSDQDAGISGPPQDGKNGDGIK